MLGTSSQISTNLEESKVALYSGALAVLVEVLFLNFESNKKGSSRLWTIIEEQQQHNP